MKQFYSAGLILAAAVILASCGTHSQNGPDAAFFERSVAGEITVSAYESSLYKRFLEDAAQAFGELYPEVTVNIETFSVMPVYEFGVNGEFKYDYEDDPQARADYLNRVSTRLMSGNGADIYAMDHIPIHKFVKSGVLENLEPYMEKDPSFGMEDYRRNIIEALRYKDGIWFLPMDYYIFYFTYNSRLFPSRITSDFGLDKAWNTRNLFSLAIPFFDGSSKIFNTPKNNIYGGGSEIYHWILSENMKSFYDLESGRAYFTDGNFAAFLDSIAYYAEGEYVPAGEEDRTERVFYKRLDIGSLLFKFLSTTARGRVIFTDPWYGDDDEEVAGVHAYEDGSVPFLFSQGFGMNADSKNKEAAWAFLRFLMSKETQASDINWGWLPLHNEARREKTEFLFSAILNNSYDFGENAMDEEERRIMENYMAAAEKIADSINAYVLQDSILNDMIWQELPHFYDGSRSALETARALQSKADLYLGE